MDFRTITNTEYVQHGDFEGPPRPIKVGTDQLSLRIIVYAPQYPTNLPYWTAPILTLFQERRLELGTCY
jgi:hypothetical protein